MSYGSMSSPYMAPRYGIWGENPYGAPTALGVGMSTGQGLANMAETQARVGLIGSQTQDQNLKNAFTQQTQPGLVNYTNADDAAKAQYALPNVQAGYQKVVDDNKETLARVGYTNAQTGATDYTKNPIGAYDAIYREYQLTQDNTQKKYFLAGQLNKLIASGGGYLPSGNQASASSSGSSGGVVTPPAGSSTTGSTGSSSVPAPSGGNGYTINPLTVSSKSMRGASYSQTNPDGSTTLLTSPTTAADTAMIKRQQGDSEIKVFNPTIQQGAKPYQGFGNTVAFGKDIYENWRNNDPNAAARLQGLALSNMLIPEAAGATGRLSTGGEPGSELVKRYSEANYPGLISSGIANYFTPGPILAAANDQYNKIQDQAVKAAAINTATGSPVTTTGPTNWINAPGNQPLLFTGDSKRDAQNLIALNTPKAAPSSTTNNSAAPVTSKAATGQQAPAAPQIYKGYSMADINAAAAKYGKTPQEMMAYIDKHSGGNK